ncbi:anti-phage-associated DUF499 domain-containing protein [Siccirubricoccus phaeus]|uniref:anti-phage-associated DUF499 domain-containing protein n=1 Tax=Siccirubricoccus phaeus TaxID=2595053 RepID=UPI0011F315B7|nr:anti-phage-associated DUF499 domain-containing protein [Siccirubricoccus phaeus]
MLLTVRDACRPHPSVLRADPEPDIEDIAQVIKAAERDAEAFFARNHVTGGMRQMFELGIARLDGRSDQAVYTLTQAMGGGKTHLMVAFGLVAKAPTLRTKVLDANGIKAPSGFGAARVVAFSGRTNPDHFIWGEIASQLGKADAFAKFWQSGPKAPDEKDWMALIGDEPTLILLDELPPWLDNAQTLAVGQGTLANVATYALANLLSAAIKLPRTMVVVSNLSAAYQGASKSLSQVLSNLDQEVRRSAKEITPVALNSNEIFEILRRRLFEKLPDRVQVDKVADAYAKAMDEAVRSRMVAKTPEQFADEIHRCYPFHPRLRDVVAMFRNNEKFRQTRGLLRMVSRVVRDVWQEGRPNTVHLIGVQHMDLNDPDMRNEVLPLSDLQEAIAKDIADNGQSNAETIDRETGTDAGTQVANVILAASLMRGLDAKAGLTRDQTVECLIAPGRAADEFAAAFDSLLKAAWYLHRGVGDVVYFAPQENITKRLQSEAEKAPQNRIDQGISDRLRVVFAPAAGQGKAYQDVLPLPELGDIDLSKDRKLIVISPDSKLPPEMAEKLFGGFVQKNNFLVVTGSSTHFASLEGAMRRLYAAEKVLKELRTDDPLREEVQDRRNAAEFDLLTTIEQTFNRVWYPGRKPGQGTGLLEAKLELRTARDQSGRSSLAGEMAVETALDKVGKLIRDPEAKADMLKARIEDQLWPQGDAFKTIPWSDITAKAKEKPEFVWLPPGGLEAVKRLAISKKQWRDRENGRVERGPFTPDKTRVSVTQEHRDPATGEVTLSVQALDAGPTPRVHAAEGAAVSTDSPEITDLRFKTSALRWSFLVVDPSGQHPTGEPVTWRNQITIQHRVIPSAQGKMVELVARPSAATIRYTLGGLSPRESGTVYEGPFPVAGSGEVMVRALAVDGEIEGEETFSVRLNDRIDDDPPGDDPPTVADWVDENRPAVLSLTLRRTSTADVFQLADALNAAAAKAQVASLSVGEGQSAVMMRLGGDTRLTGDAIARVIEVVRAAVGGDDAPVTAEARSVSFPTGRDLIGFVDELRLDIVDPRNCITQPTTVSA